MYIISLAAHFGVGRESLSLRYKALATQCAI